MKGQAAQVPPGSVGRRWLTMEEALGFFLDAKVRMHEIGNLPGSLGLVRGFDRFCQCAKQFIFQFHFFSFH
jgi:hypothetical protein